MASLTEPPKKILFSYGEKNYQATVKKNSCLFKKHFCCFIDILGTSNAVMYQKDQEFIDEFYAVLDICSQIQKDKGNYISIKTFSDNICISTPVPEDEDEAKIEFFEFLKLISLFQLMIVYTTGTLLRGGVTAGELFVDDNIIWGKAIVDAVAAEKNSKFPRIMINEEYCCRYISDKTAPLVIKDPHDHKKFINFLCWIKEENNQDLNRFHDCLKKQITYLSNENYEKIFWTCEYYNYVAKHFNRSDLVISASINIDGKDYKID